MRPLCNSKQKGRAQRRRVCATVLHGRGGGTKEYDNMRAIAHVCDVQFIIEPWLHGCMHACMDRQWSRGL